MTQADLVIDTTELNVHQLKDGWSARSRRGGSARLQIAVESFGYKHGLPLDADIVMDVRFLPNPHWDEELRPLTGLDQAVRDYVLETAAGHVVPRPLRRPARAAPRLPGRGPELPHDRHRLHGRAPPLGRDRRGAGPAVPRPAASPPARRTATSPQSG